MRTALLLLALWVLAAPAAGRELPPWIEIRMPAGGAEPTPPALSPEREAELRDQGHGYVDLLWKTDVVLEASGRARIRTRLVRRFLTDSGVESSGNLEVDVATSRERLFLDHAYTLLDGGERRDAQPELIQVVDGAEPNVFSDVARVVVPLPALAPGRTAVLDVERILDTRRWPIPWSELVFLESGAPTELREVRISWEAGAPEIEWRSDADDATCVRRERGVACRRERVRGLLADGSVASYLDEADHLVLGIERGWADLAGRIGGFVEERSRPTPALERTADAIVAGAADDEERLERIQRFVADEIRYVALEHGESAVVPRPAEETLERRFGDCKDKVTLLVALARIAGVEARPVLTSSARYRLDRLLLPSASYFDHMIACAGLDETVCVDPTLRGTGAELPLNLQGAIALELGPGTEAPHNLPRADFGWRIRADTETEVDCEGEVTRRTDRSYAGPASIFYRTQLRGMRVEERRRLLMEEFRNSVALDAAPEFAVRGLSDPTRPFVVHSEVVQPDVSKLQGDVYDDDHWLISYARGLLAENQFYDYRMPGMRYRSSRTYALCPEQEVVFAGASLDFQSPFGSLTRHYVRDGSRVAVETEFSTRARTLTPEELGRFREFLIGSVGQAKIWFFVE